MDLNLILKHEVDVQEAVAINSERPMKEENDSDDSRPHSDMAKRRRNKVSDRLILQADAELNKFYLDLPPGVKLSLIEFQWHAHMAGDDTYKKYIKLLKYLRECSNDKSSLKTLMSENTRLKRENARLKRQNRRGQQEGSCTSKV